MEREKAKLEAALEKDRIEFQAAFDGEKAHLEAVLQASLHKEKVRFDTEFRLYSRLWNKLCRVKRTIHAIEFHRNGATNPTLDELRNVFDLATERLEKLAEFNQPFYTAKIHEELFAAIRLARDERKRDHEFRSTRPPITIRVDGMRNLFALRDMITRICELIRVRLEWEG